MIDGIMGIVGSVFGGIILLVFGMICVLILIFGVVIYLHYKFAKKAVEHRKRIEKDKAKMYGSYVRGEDLSKDNFFNE